MKPFLNYENRLFSTEDKATIVGLHQAVLNQREITAQSSLTHLTVSIVLQDCKKGKVEGPK